MKYLICVGVIKKGKLTIKNCNNKEVKANV
ncbi:hypothetical protein SAMN04488529_11437 [Clostridium gasigenes]|uniref:Uncharacterized protein n=1 Tax=Clostridium gasigenes TaxID=94869 RepID=A0A1H0V442_9CLOT|nr:hypothetical protein SAMN04488529_11437 [Clostridium gasigenes]